MTWDSCSCEEFVDPLYSDMAVPGGQILKTKFLSRKSSSWILGSCPTTLTAGKPIRCARTCSWTWFSSWMESWSHLETRPFTFRYPGFQRSLLWRFMVWVNGTQNLGLVNFQRPVIAFTIVQISSSKKGREGLKMVTKIASMKWNTDFRLEHSFRENRTTFSGVPLLP